MGIYDREYYRAEGGGWRWFSGTAPACKTLIAINVAAYMLQWMFPALRLSEIFGANSADIFRKFMVYQPLTATFLHDPNNVLHIIWNMLFLWWFGSELEGMLGSREFTFFYLAAAVLSTLGWAVVDAMLPGGGQAVMLGASGAVTAVAVVMTLFFPNRQILLFFVFPVPLWAFLIIYLGQDALALLQEIQSGGQRHSSGVAFASHLSGALFGFVYKQSQVRLERWLIPRFRPRLRVIAPELREPARPRAGRVGRGEPARGPREISSPQLPQEELDARLDDVLAKIAREGRDALTESERLVLEESSRRARMRRSNNP